MPKLEKPAPGAKVKMLWNSKLEDFFNIGQVVKIIKVKNKGETVNLFGDVNIKLEDDAFYIDIPGLGNEYFYREAFEYPIKVKENVVKA